MKTHFSGTQKSSIFGGLDGPGTPESTPKGEALRAPPFGVVSGATGAVQTCKIDDFWVSHDYIDMKLGLR